MKAMKVTAADVTELKTDGKWHLCVTLLGPRVKNDDWFDGPLFPTLYSQAAPEKMAQQGSNLLSS